mgnify:CR=1 FL=1
MSVKLPKSTRVSKAEISYARELLREYGGRLYFRNMLRRNAGPIGAAAEVDLQTKSVSLERVLLRDRAAFWSAIFHEMGHLYCQQNNIYRAYHVTALKEKLTAKEKRALVQTGWRAETYVDRWGAKEMSKYFPDLKYQPGYSLKEHKQWLHDTYLCYYKDQRYLKNRPQ